MKCVFIINEIVYNITELNVVCESAVWWPMEQQWRFKVQKNTYKGSVGVAWQRGRPKGEAFVYSLQVPWNITQYIYTH